MEQKKLTLENLMLRHFGHDLAKRWYWEWYENGKRKKAYISAKDCHSVEERIEVAQRLRTKLESGLCLLKPSTSVIFQHIEPVLIRHSEVLRATSVKEYRTVILNFDNWLVGCGCKDLHPKKLTKQLVDDYCRYLLVEKKLSNATYNKYVNTLDMLFTGIVEKEIIQKSPFRFVKRKKKESVSVSCFQEKDIPELKALLKEQNMTVYISCMVDLYAFIRPKEIRFLRLKDIDFQNNTIYVDKSVSKNKKSQYVAIVPALKVILSEYIGVLREPDFFLLSKTGKPGTEQISSKYVVENHNRILGKKGYDTEKLKPYSWKHTGNSLAFKNGASMEFLCRQNRHHSVTMTEIYIKSIVATDLVKGQEPFFDF